MLNESLAPATLPPAHGANAASTAPAGEVAPMSAPQIPMSKGSAAATRIAVAIVFILGLALGIFGARRVVMMRQAAQDDSTQH